MILTTVKMFSCHQPVRMHPLPSEAWGNVSNMHSSFSKTPDAKVRDHHESTVRQAWETFHIGELLFEIETNKNKGSLRSKCNGIVNKAIADGADPTKWQAVLTNKLNAIKKMA